MGYVIVPRRYRQKGVCFTENPNFKNLERRLQGMLFRFSEILETKMEVPDGFFSDAYDFPLVISQAARCLILSAGAWPAMQLGGEMHQERHGLAKGVSVSTPNWGALKISKIHWPRQRREAFADDRFGDVEF